MNRAASAFHKAGNWTLSVQLLVLYCVSVALFFAVDRVNVWFGASRGNDAAGGGGRLAVFLAALATNAAAVAAFVYGSRALGIVPRLAMIALPLFLVAEENLRKSGTEASAKTTRRLLAAGAVLGMVLGAAAFMRGCPLK